MATKQVCDICGKFIDRWENPKIQACGDDICSVGCLEVWIVRRRAKEAAQAALKKELERIDGEAGA